MKLSVIHAGNFKLDGGAMFGVVPKSIWNRVCPADENNLCSWAMRCLLIDTGDRRILVDTGMGNKQDAKFFGHYYLHGGQSLQNSLKQAGYCADDVTDVFHTHLHFDHCGGSIVKQNDALVPAFKDATYWSNKAHWQWATNPNDREKASFLKENILPMQASGKLQFVAAEQQFLHSDITIRYVYGHTEAMMLPAIQYKNRTIVYMADLLPSTAHIPLPYVMSYDMFPLKTLAEKKAFLQQAVAENFVLFFEHDIHVECCTLHETDKGIRVKETFKLADI